MTPIYPVYVISKGRYKNCMTANFFVKDKLNFKIVVEPQEEEEYRKRYGDRVLVLPFSNLGQGSTPARNFCWKHSIDNGFKRHWIFDDNIEDIRRLVKGKRIPVNSNIALSIVEEFTDRYTNIAISGFNYSMFVLPTTKKPYYQNCHVYSALLIKNNMPHRWRLRYNEDTDLCLQVLTNNMCTISFNVFSVKKMQTMTMKGGNSDQLYKQNGRLVMARTLEEIWSEYVEVKWKFGRPQHHIKNNWGDFKTPLKRRTDIDWEEIERKEYKMNLKAVKEIKSQELKKFYKKNKDA